MYKLIAIDMDGTLLKSDKSVSERTKKAIREAQEKGVNVVIATGRPIDGVTRYLEELNMLGENDYVLSYNGGLVLKAKSREVISKTVLNGSDLHYLHKLSKELGVNIHAFSEVYGLITPKNSKYTEVEANINGINIGINDFSEIEDDHSIVKVMMIGGKQEEVMTFGDAENDLDMIVYAGMGVAMDNAFAEVKEVANYITDSNENDGVAKAIEKFVL